MSQTLEVPTEIMNQLKVLPVPKMGMSFLLLTGAHKFRGDSNSLTFSIKHKNRTRINTIKITLNAIDLYDIEYWDCRLLHKDPFVVNDQIDSDSGVYAANLAAVLADKVRLS